MNVRDEIQKAFDGYVLEVWPGLSSSTQQHKDLRRTFLAGMFVTVEKLSRPRESIETAEEYVLGLMNAIKDELAEFQSPHQGN